MGGCCRDHVVVMKAEVTRLETQLRTDRRPQLRPIDGGDRDYSLFTVRFLEFSQTVAEADARVSLDEYMLLMLYRNPSRN